MTIHGFQLAASHSTQKFALAKPLRLQYYDTNNEDFIKLAKINIQKAGHKKGLVSSTCVLLTIVIVALQASQFLLDSHRN